MKMLMVVASRVVVVERYVSAGALEVAAEARMPVQRRDRRHDASRWSGRGRRR